MSEPEKWLGEAFYRHTPVVRNFSDILNPDNFHSLPDDWLVGATDIVDSTKAIAEGRYKEVNILGASPIVAMLNVAGSETLPYAFCGDGSVICIPPGLRQSANNILYRCRLVGRKQYELELRASLIPVSYIRQNGFQIRVARYRVSDDYLQAMFTGGGIRYADRILKQSRPAPFEIEAPEEEETVDFSGLECRWNEVSNEGSEVITLLVGSHTRGKGKESARIYEEVIDQLRELFGFDTASNPVQTQNLTMRLSIPALLGEARLRTFDMNLFDRVKYFLTMQFEIVVGKVLMFFGIETSQTDWGRYKSDLMRNSDYRKFDDMLRAVVSVTPDKRKELEAFLLQKFNCRELAYGLHVSNSAIITCMVFRYQREHIHFIDGSRGGYVEASKALKRRMAELESGSRA